MQIEVCALHQTTVSVLLAGEDLAVNQVDERFFYAAVHKYYCHPICTQLPALLAVRMVENVSMGCVTALTSGWEAAASKVFDS